ncbi:MAG: ArsR/SmtB family transcription factor [Bacillota bacterium]
MVMEESLVLEDLEKIKAIADPLRVKVLEILIQRQATVKQVADSLGQSSAKMHYHVKELEKQKLIRLVETMEKGGILEKYYRAVAKSYKLDYKIS